MKTLIIILTLLIAIPVFASEAVVSEGVNAVAQKQSSNTGKIVVLILATIGIPMFLFNVCWAIILKRRSNKICRGIDAELGFMRAIPISRNDSEE